MPVLDEIGEEELLKSDEEIKKMTSGKKLNTFGMKVSGLKTLLVISNVSVTMANNAAHEVPDGERQDYTMIYLMIFMTMMFAIIMEKLITYGFGYIRNYIRNYLTKTNVKIENVAIKKEPMDSTGSRKRKAMVNEGETIAMEVDRCAIFDAEEEEDREVTIDELERRLEEKEDYMEALTKNRDYYKDQCLEFKEAMADQVKSADKLSETLGRVGES